MADDRGALGTQKHENERADRKGIDWVLLACLLSAATYLYLNLFALPRTPYLLGGDQTFFWTYAQRMLGGEKIYKDFFQFTPPGTDLIYFASFKLFGPHMWVTNAVVFVLGIALCWICFAVASEIMAPLYALLAAALFLVFIYGKVLSGTHHFFSALAVMCAVKISLKESSSTRSLAAGALLGLASFFTQTRGAMALLGLIAFLVWEQFCTKKFQMSCLRNPTLLVLGYFTALLLLNAHFIAYEGLRQLWYLQVTYVRQHVVRDVEKGFLGLPPLGGQYSLFNFSECLFVYILLPVVFCVALWQCWREREHFVFPWRQVALLSAVGLGLLLEVAFSANWMRVFAVSMPGVILFLWCIARPGRLRRAVFVVLWIGTISLAVRQTVARNRFQTVIAQLPAGTVAVDPINYERLHWIMQHTSPGQFFFQPGGANLYLPLELHNPAYTDTIEVGNRTPPENVLSTIRVLEERRVKYILWTTELDSESNLPGVSQDNVLPLRTYVHSRYTEVKVFPNGGTILQRNE